MNALGPTLYDRIGGEDGVATLVRGFYDAVEQDPRLDALHRLHLRGHGVAHARQEQFDFLSGFLGGPRLYVERHGHARLKEIHAHLHLDSVQRDLWIEGMRQAVAKAGFEPAVGELLLHRLSLAAEMVRNQP